MAANEMQVGGNHYGGTSLQHWDYTIRALGNRYLEGAITKYVMRHRKKGVAEQDLNKAAHFLAKLREEFDAGRVPFMGRPVDGAFPVHRMCVEQGLNVDETLIVEAVTYWRNATDLARIGLAIARLQEDEHARQARAQATKAGANPL